MRSRGRGRGRGGFRGGRGGRGGRSRGRGDGKETDPKEEEKEIDVVKESRRLFLGTASSAQHAEGQKADRIRYAATLAVLFNTGVQVSQNARIRGLAMAFARNDQELASTFLQVRSQFGMIEVLKALTLLDAGRQVRALEKKLKRLELSKTKVRPHKLGKLKSDIDNLNATKPPSGSLSGAVSKHVAKWVRNFTDRELEFYAMHYPKDPWKKLSDLCHLHPVKDFPSAPWFLPFCYGTGSPPSGSIVERCLSLTAENVNELIEEFDIPYSSVKQHKDKLTSRSKARLAEYEKLDTVLWWYEDLQSPEVDQVVDTRLASGEQVSLPNGKLLERLLTIHLIRNPHLANRYYGQRQQAEESSDKAIFLPRLIQLAEPKLTSIRLSLEAPIVIIGDASGSMEVAIRTSTIIASLLTAITSARLVFFNNENREAPFLPKTVDEMLNLAVTTKAGGGTTPAASLWPFYEKKEVVKTFIIVTDEEENGICNSHNFASLYKMYYEEVYEARLVFVSFLRSQHSSGHMVDNLNRLGYHPLQFRLEGARPDLTKLDNLFGLLSAESVTSGDDLAHMEQRIRNEGLKAIFSEMNHKLAGAEEQQIS